jgi:hypothetical protein
MSIKIKKIIINFSISLFVDVIGIFCGYLIKCALL